MEYASLIPEPVLALLREESTLSLATVSSEGEVSIAPVFYYVDHHLHLYWFSSAKSEHSRNLRYKSIVSASVYHATAEWKQIRGVQMRGTVQKILGKVERESVSRAYRERFHLGSIFQIAMNESVLYRLEPTWIRYLDNGVHFGYKKEYRKLGGIYEE
jgi:uncharacterized protein YhbP (UPF0306 family)